jgi:hypothetical protein
MLVPAVGLAVELASLSLAVPMPTLSTRVVPASLYSKIVLLAVIALDVAE